MIVKCLKGLSLLWETLAAKDLRRPSVVVSFIPKPQRHRFPVPRYAKCPDVALYAIGPLFLLPAPSSPHCTLRVFETYCNLVNAHTSTLPYVFVRFAIHIENHVVVVDSHIQRIVLVTEKTTVTQQVSHRPIKCQSCLCSQRGTKVNGSHHGDNPLLRPTGIQIATKRYAALQAMAPNNIKTVHQTSLLHIESNLDRL